MGSFRHSRVGPAFDRQSPPPPQSGIIDIHHFGEVRNSARLRQKWNMQSLRHGRGATWFRIPSFVFSLFPHNWLDPDLLPHLSLYDGRIIDSVERDPNEFIRDRWKTFKYLSDIASRGSIIAKG